MLADVGLPMIVLQLPAMICALAPVIVIEALLIRRWVTLSHREAFTGIAKANLISTFIGVPAAWLIMCVFEFTATIPLTAAVHDWYWKSDSPVLQAVGYLLTVAWLYPVPDEVAAWLVPAAAAVLLIPCFFVSVRLERSACLKSWVTSDPDAVRRGVCVVNVASYALLFVMACGWTAYEVLTRAR
jgi:hypothetical protein